MDEITKSYLSWLEKCLPEFHYVSSLLKVKLSDEPEEIFSQLADAEAWDARIKFMLAEANTFLDKAERYFLPEDAKNATEAKIILTEKTCDFREFRDKCEALVDSLKQRLILGSSFLAYLRQFKDHTVGNSFSLESKETTGRPF